MECRTGKTISVFSKRISRGGCCSCQGSGGQVDVRPGRQVLVVKSGARGPEPRIFTNKAVSGANRSSAPLAAPGEVNLV